MDGAEGVIELYSRGIEMNYISKIFAKTLMEYS